MSGPAFGSSSCGDVINAWKGRTSCTSFVRCNDMWLAKDNRFMNPMSTYEWNLMAPTCLIINYFSCQIPILACSITIWNQLKRGKDRKHIT